VPVTCDNMNDFIRNLKQEVEKHKLQNETLYIVSFGLILFMP
jgi:hypothetical protein